MAASASLFDRLVQSIRTTFNRDDLRMIVVSCLDRTFDWLVTDKALRYQVVELLLTLDETGEVPTLLACLRDERPLVPLLAALFDEVSARQDQAGEGKPIFAAEAKRRDRTPIPLQRPRRVEHFTGRDDELKKLMADLQPGEVVTLAGPAGIGKSALAAEAVWLLAPGDDPPERFPDGVIHHSFYGQPQTDYAFEKIASAYQIELKSTLRDAAIQALANKRALLILEATESADNLEAVLEVAGSCGVLITTRRSFDAQGETQDIAKLPTGESLALLRAFAGAYAADEGAANEIVRLLDGLPLAISLVGKHLSRRKQKASEYAKWLERQGLAAVHFGERPDRSVRLLLRHSLEQVSAEAQAAFGIVGVLAPAPFTADPVAAALEMTVDAAQWALADLVDYGLLLRPDDPYQVTHALAHGYARTHAAPDGETVARLALHYAALAERERARGPAGFAVLDDHRAHIVAVQAAALAAKQWHAVREITWKVRDYLDLKGYWTDRLTVIHAGLDAARAAGDRYDEGVFLNSLGFAYYSLGETRRAVELYEQALVIDREIGDRRGEGAALGNLGLAYADLGQPRRAIELYEQQLVIAREISDRRGEGIALNNLGLAYADLGETRRAVEYHEQQLVIVRQIGDRRGEGNALGSLGNAYAALGETRRAVEYHEQYLAIAREIGDRRGEGRALGNLGSAHTDLGETRRAVEYHEQDLVIAREIGDRRGEGNALGSLGNAYAALGETRRAVELYEQCLVVMREIGDRRGEGNALGNLGNAYYSLGETRRAVELFEQRLVIAREIGDRRGEGNALGNLGSAYKDLGETRRAVELYEQALPILHELGDRRLEAIHSWNLGVAYEKLGDLARAVANLQVLVGYYEELGHPDAAKDAQAVAEVKRRAGL